MLAKTRSLIKYTKLFLLKLFIFITDLKSYYFPEKNVIDFINHNKKTWKTWKVEGSDNLILFEYCGTAETEIAQSYSLNILAKKFNASIASYTFRQLNFRARIGHWAHIYRSYNVTRHFIVKLNAKQKKKSRALFNKIIPKIQNKRDVYDLKIFNVWIGLEIYEEYLMRYTEPTVLFDDPRLVKIIREAIDAFVYWKDFFEENNVKAIGSSHIGVRISSNLPCKIAGQLFNIPFYSAHARSVSYYPEPHKHHENMPKRYNGYPKLFKKLPPSTQNQGLQWAKERLQKRLSGEVGVDMAYSTKSAFVQVKGKKPVLRKNGKVKILICTHEFYDSPNGYGGLLFMDFLEWLIFLGDISKRTDYDWYVKTHPDASTKSKRIIGEIVGKYPSFKLISPEISFHQLAEEGIGFVLTCYGSVGHEAPLLGMQVINASNNPHMGYDFNWHPKTLDEYEALLLDLNSLNKKINFDDIYEFYFMQYKGLGSVDNWIYPSYSKLQTDLTESERFGPDIFPYFLKGLTPQRHQRIISRFTSHINSGKIGSPTHLDFN